LDTHPSSEAPLDEAWSPRWLSIAIDSGKVHFETERMFTLYLDTKLLQRWESLGGECQRRLTAQQITPGGPGTILKDIETFLEFVGLDGIITQSRSGCVPVDRVPELNLKISNPIQLNLNRALLQDYPNLAGLFILLRVMDLLQIKSNRLHVASGPLQAWRQLTPTEQYFALLEAHLFRAQSAVLGGEIHRRESAQAFESVAAFLGGLSERWRNFSRYESLYSFSFTGELPPWHAFLLRQFGLIEIRQRLPTQEARDAKGWILGGAKLTPWGAAITWGLLELLKQDRAQEDECDSDPDPGQDTHQPAVSDETAEELDTQSQWAAPLEEDELERSFGTLHPIFQTYFPEWQALYTVSEPEVRSGTHFFKVTLTSWPACGKVWRRLAVPPDISLDTLAGAILHAFEFDDDHLYDFRYRDVRGRDRVYCHPYSDQGPFTPEITVGETELALQHSLHFTFDYGDKREFEVRLEQVKAGVSDLLKPQVVEACGKPPEQYPRSSS
jgi:hypothetical protein